MPVETLNEHVPQAKRFPEVEASYSPKCVTVEDDPVQAGNVIAWAFVPDVPLAADQSAPAVATLA
jgi:hypothetical protein